MMQIIFDPKLARELANRYVILELDTIMQTGMEHPMPLYAVVENIPLEDLAQLDSLKELHAQLIGHYKSGDWAYIEEAVAPLIGKWNGSLDSFYQEVLDFSAECAKLNTKWDGVRHTVPNE